MQACEEQEVCEVCGEVLGDGVVTTVDMDVAHMDCCCQCVECDEWVKIRQEERGEWGESYCEECYTEVMRGCKVCGIVMREEKMIDGRCDECQGEDDEF